MGKEVKEKNIMMVKNHLKVNIKIKKNGKE